MTNRFAPKSPNSREADLISMIAGLAEELMQVIDEAAVKSGRHRALAQTHLETAVMFACKGVTG